MYRLRKTMMYVPGNNPGMFRYAQICAVDSIIFDLEESVSLNEKDAARFLVYNELKSIDYEGVETIVRINRLNTPYGIEDLEAMVRARPDAIRVPKIQCAQDVIDVENEITRIEKNAKILVGRTKMIACIKGDLGILSEYQIATASKRLIGTVTELEDYVTDLKTIR